VNEPTRLRLALVLPVWVETAVRNSNPASLSAPGDVVERFAAPTRARLVAPPGGRQVALARTPQPVRSRTRLPMQCHQASGQFVQKSFASESFKSNATPLATARSTNSCTAECVMAVDATRPGSSAEKANGANLYACSPSTLNGNLLGCGDAADSAINFIRGGSSFRCGTNTKSHSLRLAGDS
jgi:hypothetical protein